MLHRDSVEGNVIENGPHQGNYSLEQNSIMEQNVKLPEEHTFLQLNQEQAVSSFATRSNRNPYSSQNKTGVEKRRRKKKRNLQEEQTGTILEYFNKNNQNSQHSDNDKAVRNENLLNQAGANLELNHRKGRSKKRKKTKTTQSGKGSRSGVDVQKSNYEGTSCVSNGYFEITEELLSGIESCGLLNAGQSLEALEYFLDEWSKCKHLAWTIVFADQQMTTPFLSSSKRYCTEKTKSTCTHWNCTCDGQVRALQSRKPVFCAMFMLGSSSNNSQKVDKDVTDECYLMPLGRAMMDGKPETLNDEFKRIKKWPVLPFECNVPIKQRWVSFINILKTVQDLSDHAKYRKLLEGF